MARRRAVSKQEARQLTYGMLADLLDSHLVSGTIADELSKWSPTIQTEMREIVERVIATYDSKRGDY